DDVTRCVISKSSSRCCSSARSCSRLRGGSMCLSRSHRSSAASRLRRWLLFWAATTGSLRDVRRNARPILLLAFALVIVTTAAVAAVAHAIAPELTWPAAFVLGAIVAPPDADVTTAIARRLGVPSRLVTVLEGETLLND